MLCRVNAPALRPHNSVFETTNDEGMAKIYKTEEFSKLAKKCGITTAMLCTVAAGGGSAASLGRHLFKARTNLNNDRVIYAAQQGSNTFFLYAYEKREMENIPEKRESQLALAAKVLLASTATQLDNAVATGKLQEVTCPNTTNA